MQRLWCKHTYRCQDVTTYNDYMWILTTQVGRFLVTANVEHSGNYINFFRVSISYWVNGWQIVLPKHEWMTSAFSDAIYGNSDRFLILPTIKNEKWDMLFNELLLLSVEIIDGD